MIRTRWAALAAVIGLVALTTHTKAQAVHLVFPSLSPVGSSESKFFNAWAKKVNDAANGTLNVEVRDGTSLANFGNVYERVTDDVIQIGWAQQAFVAGKFPLSGVVGLPFLVDNDVAGSVAFWRLYKSGLLNNEYQGIVPLWVALMGATGLHLAKAPATLDNLHGLKIRVNAKVTSDVVTRLGGAPISLAADDMYEGLQRGTIDGVMTSWAAFEPYRLFEVTTYHVEAPLGEAPAMFFMTKSKFDSLPKLAQEALMSNSGAAAARAWGMRNVDQTKVMRDKTLSLPGQKVVQLSAQQYASWKKAVEPVITSWEKDNPGGDKVVTEFRKLYAEAAASK
jgi:TRAP-type C4-dicarboxylate transport system substrate-binding protein